MSKTWKWILGIVIVLLFLGVIGGASFMAMRAYNVGAVRVAQSAQNGQLAPGNPGEWRMPMHGYDGQYMMPYHQRGFGGGFYPGMGMRGGYYGMMPFGMGFFWLGGLFRLIIPLGLIALVLFLGYQWGKRAGRPKVAPAAAAATVTPPPAAENQAGEQVNSKPD